MDVIQTITKEALKHEGNSWTTKHDTECAMVKQMTFIREQILTQRISDFHLS